MQHVFDMREPSRVPDGTLVSAFLNPKDSNSALPFDVVDGFSIAGGSIEAGERSRIHVLPFVTQVTFVRRGNLKAWMKSADDEAPYALAVGADQAVLTPPGTLLQLVNDSDQAACELLYIVSPAYLFLFDETARRVVYDDATVLDEDWNALRRGGWRITAELPDIADRRAAYERLAALRSADAR